jgi:hypothetical protein
MIEDNIYFIDTPVEIQDEAYYKILEQLNQIEIPDNKNIYLKLTPIFNIPGKYYFNVYIQDTLDINLRPDFLIFLQ